MKSTCCNAETHVTGNTTKWFECLACGKPCDVRDEASAADQLREYWQHNSMLLVPDKDTKHTP